MTDQILNMARKLQYISTGNGKVNVLIDGNAVEVNKDEFIEYVQLELKAGKTLVSSIRDTVFRSIRLSGLSRNTVISHN